jgi:group I intron endonuclease
VANTDLTRPSEVYIATNLVNGKFYIGVTTQGRLGRRIYEHGRAADSSKKQYKNKFYNAIRKHGIKNFHFEVVERYPTMAEGFVAEIRLIAELKPQYNSTKGGEHPRGGGPLSPEGRERQKAACRGNKWRLGKSHTLEVREKLSRAAIANPVALKTFGHLGPIAISKKVVCLNTGEVYKSASEAARQNNLDKGSVISICQRSKRRVAAGKGDLVFRYLGDHLGGEDEVRQMLSKRRILSKEVVCMNDGAIYPSLLNASKTCGIPHGTLQRHCIDSRPLKNGLRFKYVSEIDQDA